MSWLFTSVSGHGYYIGKKSKLVDWVSSGFAVQPH
jgi:uncharacterized membrane protein YGL010W